LAADAHAVGGAIGSQGGAPLVQARVSVAVSEGRTTRWAQVRLDPSAGASAWLVVVWPGARVDEVPSAWLDAVDEVTAPTPRAEPQRTEQRALDIAVLSDASELSAFAAAWGFVAPPEIGARFSDLASRGARLVALVYPSSSGWTRTVRVTDTGPAVVPLGLAQAGRDGLVVTASIVASTRMRLGAWIAAELEPRSLDCVTDPGSEYRRVRDEAVLRAPEGALLEAAGHDLLWPKAAAAYVRRAVEQQGLGADACATVFAPLAGQIASACAPGLLAQPYEPRAQPCATGSDAGVGLCCGAYDDVALALSGLDSDAAWITRAVTAVAPSSWGSDVALYAEARVAQDPAVAQCRVTADAGAEAATPTVQPVPPPPPPSPPAPAPSTGSQPDQGYVWTDEPDDGTGVAWEAAGACSAEPQPSQSNGCDGSTEPAPSEDAACDGSTEPAPSEDAACDGSTDPQETPPEAGSCDAEPSGDAAQCTAARRPRPRIPLSAVTILAAAVLVPVRRWTAKKPLKSNI
jgi:hypothetical protein